MVELVLSSVPLQHPDRPVWVRHGLVDVLVATVISAKSAPTEPCQDTQCV
jgi:hypothetical protein